MRCMPACRCLAFAPEHRSEIEDHPIRKQHLALFDASTADELRETVLKLAADAKERSASPMSNGRGSARRATRRVITRR